MELTRDEQSLPRRPRVLVVAQDLAFAQTIADGLAARGFEALPVSSGEQAAQRLERETIDAVVTDLRMPSLDGLALLNVSKRSSRCRPVLLMTEYGAFGLALEAIRRGAYHYLTKPFNVEELVVFLERALEEGRQRGASTKLPTHALADGGIIGSSDAMHELRKLVERVADAAASVLISGETGTGKAMLARLIHASGPRANAPLVIVNCASPSEAAPDGMAVHGRHAAVLPGALGLDSLQAANGGTLFLREIAALPAPIQAQLLHVLENRSLEVRLLASTATNLRERVNAGLFRADLLYRVDVVHFELPPLRARSDDVPELVEHFLDRSRRRHPDSNVERVAPDALALLREHSWPGNARELEQCIEGLVLLGRGPEVTSEQLRATFTLTRPPAASFHGEILPLREIGRRYARWAFERSGGEQQLTAERLQIDDKTLNKMLTPEADRGGKSSSASK
jgi:two-component system response regulator HydG